MFGHDLRFSIVWNFKNFTRHQHGMLCLCLFVDGVDGVKSKLAMVIVVSSEEGLRKKFRHRFKATRRLTRIVLSGCNGVKKREDERFHQSNWSTGYRYRCWLIMFSFRWRGKLNSRTYIQYMSKLPLPASQRDQNTKVFYRSIWNCCKSWRW